MTRESRRCMSMSMSRNERLKQMHERRFRWKAIPRCAECGRTLTAIVDGASPCEHCLTVAGTIVADTSAVVAAAFAAAMADPERLVEQTLAIPSIWDARLRPGEVTLRVVSGTARRGSGVGRCSVWRRPSEPRTSATPPPPRPSGKPCGSCWALSPSRPEWSICATAARSW